MKKILAPSAMLAVVAGAFWAFSSASGAANDAKADIGSPAPDFELKDVYGKTFRLSDFKGKIVVLEWMNRQCPVSHGKQKDGTMAKTYKKYAKDVIWLGIDSATPPSRKITAYMPRRCRSPIRSWAIRTARWADRTGRDDPPYVRDRLEGRPGLFGRDRRQWR